MYHRHHIRPEFAIFDAGRKISTVLREYGLDPQSLALAPSLFGVFDETHAECFRLSYTLYLLWMDASLPAEWREESWPLQG